LGSALLLPDWFKLCPPSEETAPGPDPFIGDLPFSCISNKSFLARPSSNSSSYASFSIKELVSSNSTCTLSSTHKVLLLNTLYALLCEEYPRNIASSLLGSNFPKASFP